MFDLDFSPPEGLTVSLWRSLLINFADRFAPERLAPLQLTSKPVPVMLPGEMFELPWYRTIFGNIADVVSPEQLPPLELTSTPVDVGVLLGDDLSHGWQDSLLQQLRDKLSPERLPALELSAQPVAAFGMDASLQLLDWSSLIAGPKIFHSDEQQSAPANIPVAVPDPAAPAVVSMIAELASANPLMMSTRSQLVRDIGRTRFRRKIWISLATAEAIFLLVAIFKFQ
jgi:hypothetical protein